MAAEPELLAVGRVGRPHGLGGGFHVTRPRPRLLAATGELLVGGVPYRVEHLGGTAARPVLRLEGVTSRERALALRGAELAVPRTGSPALGEDEWLAEDLAGCRVHDAGTEVGIVARLLAYPSCDLLEVQRPAGAQLLVPLIGDAVRDVDLAARSIDVDLTFLGEGG